MSKKRNSSSNHKQRFNYKKGGWLILIVAVLVLGVNFILNQRGDDPLPEEIINMAEEVVEDALQQNQVDLESNQSEEELPSNDDAPPEITPLPASSQSNTQPWTNADGDFDYYVLALSWEPAFCETKPDKTECVTQSTDRYDAANFILHGLWPNIKGDDDHSFGYCNVSQDIIQQDKHGDWCDLPPLDLSEAVETELTIFMPGSESCLENHEWYKHGTCAGMPADAYYALSNQLVSRFSQTDFNQYVAKRVGRQVTRQELLTQFAAEFGQENSNFLSLRCSKVDGTSLLTEIQLVLKKDLAELNDFADLFPADEIHPQGSCPQEFKIDSVGLGNF